MRILVSGFEPFGGGWSNPSQLVVSALADAGWDTVVLPVSFAQAWPRLSSAIERADPDVVVALGQAGGSAAIAVERVAVNLDSPETADNDGCQPLDAPIVDGGPVAYFSGLPTRLLVESLRAQGVPAVLSSSAGGHLCNHVFYRLGHLAATARPGLRSGFIHLPHLPEQVADRPGPSMSLDTQVRAACAVLALLGRGEPG